MQLSYLCRLICLALFGAGLLQVVIECLVWSVSGFVTATLDGTCARRAERRMFLLVLGARIAPYILVLGLLLPSYVRGEENISYERVGLVCVAFAAVVLIWSMRNILRVVKAALTTKRYCGTCREIGRSSDGLPLLLSPDRNSLVAVAGVFRSKIIVSQALFDASRFSTGALDVALAHESAHVRHRDNLKLLLLSALPHARIQTARRPSLQQQWRLLAELAADEESVCGGGERRSVLLAETLVALARESAADLPCASIALVSRAEDLRVRVERLLEPAAVGGAIRRPVRTICAVFLPVVALGALVYCCVYAGHEIAEFALRLG
jgi:Zn-dependent protease with chaperone function